MKNIDEIWDNIFTQEMFTSYSKLVKILETAQDDKGNKGSTYQWYTDLGIDGQVQAFYLKNQNIVKINEIH